jgi:hypothetical protein
MDKFKATNIVLATSWDWNAKRVVKRAKGDGDKLRRYARRKLKQKDNEESQETEIQNDND